ncbi:hypothetical protein MPTK1_1g17680 [Marchantia polymorpha subsp. ruderalis]|uniref:Uncharacterized protein n=2 Tax=Marchantia polymorpha TaxID=3197 RepID=A0AAF6ARA3_MARPO|nr:hypothetical protein MARPO_0001s0108 [Marchantia polymorpha]BBM98973.1 hypothetical protein Mp_1g17680 [Marchantia polymorpha subsp. ruderalis]|eukprot:PTQ50050.1 hypothetical protein MARPO_0001s0108 [Marchantia polymorpha]
MQKTGSDHYNTRQSPDDVRFTKTTIDLNFPGQHELENIYDVLRALELKILQPRSLPSLRIFLHDNRLWTIDNKLLYIYRISPKVRRVSVTFISSSRFIDKFLNDNSKSDLERMASPDFFPEVVRSLADKQPAIQSSSQECVLLPTVAAFNRMDADRLSNSKSHSSSSNKSLASGSNSSSKTVATRISSDDNAQSHRTAGAAVEAESPYLRPLRTCTVRSKISLESSNNSSVTSYPVKTRSTRDDETMRQDTEANRSLDSSSAGQIYSDDFVETSSVHIGARSRVLDLRATVAFDRDDEQQQQQQQQQQPPSGSSCFRRAVIECRDIPVASTLPPVHTLTDAGALNCSRKIIAAAAHQEDRSETPDSADANFAEELSKWRDVDAADDLAAPDLMGNFSSKPMMMMMLMNQAHAGAAEAHERSGRSPPAETSANSSSDSGKQRPLRLDRPLSSCGSSAAPVLERPSTCTFPLDGRRSGSLFRICTSSTVQADRANPSPTKGRTRAFLSAEKKSQGKLSREHELEVSKKILLKHMRKAFFSVY